jgi:MYXO-CTERM domain-containing protein
MDATAVAAGESIMMSVTVYDEDDDRLAYSWRQDDVLTESGHNALDSTSSQTVTWTAPLQLPNEEKSQTFSIQVVIVDEAGNQDYAVEEITVFANKVPERLFDDKNSLEDDGKSKGCGNKSEEEEDAVAESGLLPGVALLLLAGLYRRRRD